MSGFIALKADSLIHGDGFLEHGCRFQTDFDEASFTSALDHVIKQSLADATSAMLWHQIHFPQFTNAMFLRLQANAGDDLPCRICYDIKASATMEVMTFEIEEIRIGCGWIGLESIFRQHTEDERLHSGTILIGGWAEQVVRGHVTRKGLQLNTEFILFRNALRKGDEKLDHLLDVA